MPGMKGSIGIGVLCAVILLGGCTTQVRSDGARAVFLLGFLAAANYSAVREDPVPELAPDRVISEQDCSKPVDFTLGNLRCK